MFKEEQQNLMAIIDSICTQHAWQGIQVAYHHVHSVQHFTEKFLGDLPESLDCLLLLSESLVSDQTLAYGFQDLLRKGGVFRCRGEIQLNRILKKMQQGERFLEPFILCLLYGSKKHEDELKAFVTFLQRYLDEANVFYLPIEDWQPLASKHCIIDVHHENRFMQSNRTGVWFPTTQSQLYFLNPIGQSLLISGDQGESASDFEQRCVWHALASGESVWVMDARGDYQAFSDRVDLSQFIDQKAALSAALASIKRLRSGYLLIQCLSDWRLEDLKRIVDIAFQKGISLTLVCTGDGHFQDVSLCQREVRFSKDYGMLFANGKRSVHPYFIDPYEKLMMQMVYT